MGHFNFYEFAVCNYGVQTLFAGEYQYIANCLFEEGECSYTYHILHNKANIEKIIFAAEECECLCVNLHGIHDCTCVYMQLTMQLR